MNPVFDVVTLLLGFVNIQAALLGVAATQMVSYILPSREGDGKFSTRAGYWGSRLLPFVAPVVACGATVMLEWDGRWASTDAVRGVLSGFMSEFLLRTWYKTIRGM